MATTHQVAVITNSCVKPPVNPRTGLSFTQNERERANLSNTWHGRDADYMDALETPEQYQANFSKSVNFDTANTLLETLPAELADLSDDDFYGKLTDLKSEHKKTLEMCERLYNEKRADSKSGTTPGATNGTAVPIRMGVATLDQDYSVTVMKSRIDQLNDNLDDLRQSYSNLTRDSVKDMSAAKPPSGKVKKSETLPTHTISKKGRHAWQESGYEQDYWKPLSAGSSMEELLDGEQENARLSRSREAIAKKSGGVDRIQDMWENFSVEDYAPPRTRPRSSSLSRLSSKRSSSKERRPKEKEWTHKITVPKPFSMTLRDSKKEPKKTKAMVELEEERHELAKKDEAECQKKFKATPIPAHVYLPLYDEIIEDQETKRRYNKTTCADRIKSSVKPFKFSQREEEKKKIRHAKHQTMWNDTEPTKKFRANPFPSYLFENTANDRMREDEEYRKIRVQMRAEELLHSSSLPPNMKARGEDYVMGKSRSKTRSDKARKSGIAIDSDFKPKVNQSVPDFEEIHKHFHRDMSGRKLAKEATVCKPFNLRTNSVATSRSKIYDDMMNDEETLKENRWPYQNPRARPKSGLMLSGSLSTSLDSIPSKMTVAAELRKSKTKSQFQKELETERRQLESERHRKYKEQQLKKEIARRAAANDKTEDLKTYTESKLRQYRSSERARRQEYNEQLKEMGERVKSRPLLFEQAAQVNAQQAADRRYKATLQRAGLDENFISKKGSKAGSSVAHLDDDDLEDEVSYAFSSSSKHRSRTHSAGGRSTDGKSYSEDFEDQGSSRSRLSRERSQAEMDSDVEEDIVEDLDDM